MNLDDDGYYDVEEGSGHQHEPAGHGSGGSGDGAGSGHGNQGRGGVQDEGSAFGDKVQEGIAGKKCISWD